MDLFYYIDETGTLNSNTENDRFFIMSCCITEDPQNICKQLYSLQEQIKNDPYFASYLPDFDKTGFHATANHFDIRARYYSLLNKLNLRIYSLIIDKNSQTFAQLKSRNHLYYEFLYILLHNRLIGNRHHSNFLIFEEYGTKPCTHKANIQLIIDKVVAEIKNIDTFNGTIHIEVQSKSSDINLSTADYTNYVLYQMLQTKTDKRMHANFLLLEPKIALVHSFFQKKFFSRTNRINFDAIKSGTK